MGELPAELLARYRSSVRKSLDALAALAAAIDRTPGDRALLESFRREVHRIRGSAGSYGYLGASQVCAEMESALDAWLATPDATDVDRGALTLRFLQRLGRELDLPVAGGAAAVAGPECRVVLLTRQPGMRDPLSAAARARGFTLLWLAPDHVEAALQFDPHVIALDADAIAAAADIRTRPGGAALPILLLGRPRGPEAEALAARAAVAVQEGDPPDPVRFCHQVEQLFLTTAWVGASVLAVDDDPAMTEFIRAVLEPTGIRSEALNEPTHLFEALERVNPAVLLLDVEMPEVDGLELTRAVRAREAWRDLPIVVVTAFLSPERRAALFRAGANDVVPKPVQPDELRSRVVNQLERLRTHRILEDRHPVTGAWLRHRLEFEAAAAVAATRASGQPMALALVAPAGGVEGDRNAADHLGDFARLSRWGAAHGAVAGHWRPGVLGLLFPGARADDIAEILREAIPEHGGSLSVVVTGVAGDLHDAAAPALAALSMEPGVRILEERVRPQVPDTILVEDDPAFAGMLRFALESAGFHVQTHTDGEEALEALLALDCGARRPLVLLDVDLPGLDGFSLHDRLAESRPGAFRVVFLTVHGSEAEQVRALRAGALDYLVKPLYPRVLVEKVRRWLAEAGKGRAR